MPGEWKTWEKQTVDVLSSHGEGSVRKHHLGKGMEVAVSQVFTMLFDKYCSKFETEGPSSLLSKGFTLVGRRGANLHRECTTSGQVYIGCQDRKCLQGLG